MSDVNAATDHSKAMDCEEQLRAMARTAMARMDVLVFAFEVCLNERLLKGLGDGILQYVLMFCFFG